MRPPTLPYKVAFLIGGAAFAMLTYLVGTWVYHLELDWFGLELDWFGPTLVGRSIEQILLLIPVEHPITSTTWVIGTTAVAIGLGVLFDRQVQLATRLQALAVTDGLTLIYNHRYFVQQLAVEIKRTQRITHRLALLLLDIDDFKKYNDTKGHLAGDDALRSVARVIRHSVRDTDVVARYGGEEFVVIASGSDAFQAATLAERIRRAVEQQTPVTVSIGVAGFPEDGNTVDALIKAADGAMYGAKGGGKNQVGLARMPQGAQAGRSREAAVDSK